MSLFIAEDLDLMTFKGSFPLKLFYDSTLSSNLKHRYGQHFLSLRMHAGQLSWNKYNLKNCLPLLSHFMPLKIYQLLPIARHEEQLISLKNRNQSFNRSTPFLTGHMPKTRGAILKHCFFPEKTAYH